MIHEQHPDMRPVLVDDEPEDTRDEATVRASERRLRRLFERMEQGYAECEVVRDATGAAVDWRFLTLNPALERLAGMKPADLAGRLASEALPGLGPRFMERAARVVDSQRAEHFEQFNNVGDRWHQATVYPLGGDTFAVLYDDITERKRAEVALRESEEQFRTFSNLVPDLLWITDPDGQIVSVNWRWREYTGQSVAETRLGAWIDTIHPDDREETHRLFADAFATGHALEHTLRARRHDGVYRWFLVRHVPLSNAEGHITRWYGTATDIHEARMTQEGLTDHVEAATAELRDLSRRLLIVQEEEQRRLAQELHDEVGQLVTELALSLTMAQRVTPTEYLARASTIVSDLLQQVRDLALDLRPSVLDDFGLLPALRSLIERYAQRTGVQVTFQHEGMERRFSADVEIAAYRIVQEALTNVARHAGSFSATVTAFAESVLTIQVRDEGRGFDPEARHASTGLDGMRERVVLAGGTLEIETAPGAGTTVTADFPIDAIAGDVP